MDQAKEQKCKKNSWKISKEQDEDLKKKGR